MNLFKRKKKEDPPPKPVPSEINYDHLYKEMLTFILETFGKWADKHCGPLDRIYRENDLEISRRITYNLYSYTRETSIYLKSNFIFTYKEERSNSLDFYYNSSGGRWNEYLSPDCKKKIVNKIHDLYLKALSQLVVDNCKRIEEDIKRRQELQRLCEEL